MDALKVLTYSELIDTILVCLYINTIKCSPNAMKKDILVALVHRAELGPNILQIQAWLHLDLLSSNLVQPPI